jgi:hypothetical protein
MTRIAIIHHDCQIGSPLVDVDEFGALQLVMNRQRNPIR